MRRTGFISAGIIIIVIALLFTATGCFTNIGGSPSPDVNTPVKPKPSVVSHVASTAGTASAYFAILDIKVKNDGAEGVILVVATVTQNGKTSQNEMPVYLKKGETHELKMTFPLVWKGGEWTSSVQTQIP